jgi:hypothetical protein
MNAPTAYLKAFIDGDLDSFATHAALIGVIVLAEISLAVGIWLESPKDKGFREWLGLYTVLGGCIFSVIATVLLLIFDEGISRGQKTRIDAQQSVIRSQNEQLLGLRKHNIPRNLSPKDLKSLVDDMQQFGPVKYDLAAPEAMEPASFLIPQLVGAFVQLNWKFQSYTGPLPKQPIPWAAKVELPGKWAGIDPMPTPFIGIESNVFGVKIKYDTRIEIFTKIASRLTYELNASKFSEILTTPEPMAPADFIDGRVIKRPVDDVLHIEVGAKP